MLRTIELSPAAKSCQCFRPLFITESVERRAPLESMDQPWTARDTVVRSIEHQAVGFARAISSDVRWVELFLCFIHWLFWLLECPGQQRQDLYKTCSWRLGKLFPPWCRISLYMYAFFPPVNRVYWQHWARSRFDMRNTHAD